MSQVYKSIASGPIPPAIPTSFTTDINDTALTEDPPVFQGTSVPAGNVLRVAGDNGIKTVTTPNSPAGTQNLTIRFIRGEANTVSNETVTCLTQATATDTTFTTQIIVAGYSSGAVDPLNDDKSFGAYATATISNNGGVARIVNTVDFLRNTDTELSAANITVTVAGANFLVNVTGQTDVPIAWTIALPGIVTT